jgi:hypothetical protein
LRLQAKLLHGKKWREPWAGKSKQFHFPRTRLCTAADAQSSVVPSVTPPEGLGRTAQSFLQDITSAPPPNLVFPARLSSPSLQAIIAGSCMPRNGRRTQLGFAEAGPERVFMQMRPGSAFTILIAPAYDAHVTAYEFSQFGTHSLSV